MGGQSLRAILDGDIDEAQALRWHLSSNCYPPIPHEMHEAAAYAIKHLGSDEPCGRETEDGIVHLVHGSSGVVVTCREVCDAWYLWEFVAKRQADRQEPLEIPDSERWNDAAAS